MNKHRPLWDYQQDDSEDTVYISYMGDSVAQTEKPKIAAYIVKSVNAHEALVEALKHARIVMGWDSVIDTALKLAGAVDKEGEADER